MRIYKRTGAVLGNKTDSFGQGTVDKSGGERYTD